MVYAVKLPTVCNQRSLTPPFSFFFFFFWRLYERYVYTSYIHIYPKPSQGELYISNLPPHPFPKTPNADATNLFPQGSRSLFSDKSSTGISDLDADPADKVLAAP